MITPQIDRSVGDGLENSNAPFAKDEEEDTKKQDVTSGGTRKFQSFSRIIHNLDQTNVKNITS